MMKHRRPRGRQRVSSPSGESSVFNPAINAGIQPSKASPSSPLALRAAGQTGAGLVINAFFDSSITSNANSAAIQAAINQAVATFQGLYSDPITVSILFRFSTTEPDGTPMGPGGTGSNYTVVYDRSWNSYINALVADSKTDNDRTANATLPTSPLSSTIAVRSANGRAVGLNTPPAMNPDGSIATGARTTASSR